MNSWVRSKNVHPTTHKCFKICTKPFWNDHLTNILCEKEKECVQCKNNQWRKLRHEFQVAQKYLIKIKGKLNVTIEKTQLLK